jgi:hypothetical protein
LGLALGWLVPAEYAVWALVFAAGILVGVLLGMTIVYRGLRRFAGELSDLARRLEER